MSLLIQLSIGFIAVMTLVFVHPVWAGMLFFGVVGFLIWEYASGVLRAAGPVVAILCICIVSLAPRLLSSAENQHHASRAAPELPNGKQFVVAVANFEQRGQKSYAVTDRILRHLRNALSEYRGVKLTPLNVAITEESGGSDRARELGSQKGAAVVLWGYYTTTRTKAIVTAYFNILKKPRDLQLQRTSAAFTTPIGELDNFHVQVPLSSNMSYLTLVALALHDYDRRNYSTALQILTKALHESTGPTYLIKRATALFYLGNCYYLKHSYAKAIYNYTRAISSGSPRSHTSIEAYVNLGNSWLSVQKPSLARAFFDRAVQFGKSSGTLLSRGAYRYYRFDLRGALSDLSQSIKLDHRNVHALVDRSTVESELGETRAAFQDVRRALKINHRFPGAYVSLGNLYIARGEARKAVQTYKKVLRLDPKSVLGYVNMGTAELALQDQNAATLAYKEALRISPHDVRALFASATLHLIRKEYGIAIAEYTTLLRRVPGDARAHIYRGEAFRITGKLRSAARDFDLAVKFAPNDSQALAARCYLLVQEGLMRKSLVYCSKAIQINRSEVVAYAARGAAYQGIGERRKALADYSIAIRLDPNQSMALSLRGQLLLEADDPRSAIKDLSRAIRLDRGNAPDYVNRGEAEALLGHRNEALHDFGTAAKLYREQGRVTEYRIVLEQMRELRSSGTIKRPQEPPLKSPVR